MTKQSLGRTLIDYPTTNANITAFFEQNNHKIVVLPGFVSKDTNGVVTTLGRGGSDLTASIVACAVQAEHLEIWTDVSGMYTAHPTLKTSQSNSRNFISRGHGTFAFWRKSYLSSYPTTYYRKKDSCIYQKHI